MIFNFDFQDKALAKVDTLVTVQIVSEILSANGKLDKKTILHHPDLSEREKFLLMKLYYDRLAAAHPECESLENHD